MPATDSSAGADSAPLDRPADDPTADHGDRLDDDLPHTPAWHRRLDGGVHVTREAADRAAAEVRTSRRHGREVTV